MIHWFWRATIAVAAGVALSWLVLLAVQHVALVYIRTHIFARITVFMIVPAIMSLIVYGALTHLFMRLHEARETRRRRKGLCLQCGYNLTGNVSGVCSECGAKV